MSVKGGFARNLCYENRFNVHATGCLFEVCPVLVFTMEELG